MADGLGTVAEASEAGGLRPGMSGGLRAVVEGPGRPRLTTCRSRVPVQVQRLLHLEPGVGHLPLLSPTGGVLQGDRIDIGIETRAGARVHVTTQSATRVYRTPAGPARQEVRLGVDAGSYLEYVPHPLVLFEGASFEQRIALEVAGDGALVAVDVLVPGRMSRGERWGFSRYRGRLEGRVDGEPVVLSGWDVRPAQGRPGPALRGSGDVVGALYVLGRGLSGLADELHEAASFEAADGVRAGADRLRADGGVTVHAVGPDRAGCERALFRAWGAARCRLIGRPAPGVWR